MSDALGQGARVLAPDRRGWGEAEPPEGYRATTVLEQAEDAAALLSGPEDRPALLVGSGFGAAVALGLLLARPELVAGAVLIEPPLLAFVPAANEALSADRVALGDAIRDGGLEAGAELYLSGAMAGLGPGADRLPPGLAAEARRRPRSLFAELAAIPAWKLPFAALRSVECPSRVVVSEGTPELVGQASAALAERLAGAELVELPGRGPAHLDGAAQIAALVAELSRRA